jgi:hypothetical protein
MNQDDLSFLSREKQSLTSDKLDKLSDLSRELKELRDLESEEIKCEILRFINDLENKSKTHVSILTLESILKTYKQEEALISQNLIPSILNECGLASIKLVTGEVIEIKDKIKASISNEKIEKAFKEMVDLEKENGLPYDIAFSNINPLFKESIILKNLSEDEKSRMFDLLFEREIPYDRRKEIHWQTLNSYIKNRLELGQTIPKSINVYKYQETKIK